LVKTLNTQRVTWRFWKIIPFVSLIAIFAMGPAHAASVTFSNFNHVGSDTIDYIVTIEDDAEWGVTANKLRFSYQVDTLSTSTVAKLTGFFFDAENPFSATPGPYTSLNILFSDIQPNTNCGLGFNTNKIRGGGGCKSTLQLGPSAGSFQGHEWDVGAAWKDNDLMSLGEIGIFEVSDLGGTIGVGNIGSIGLRGQATTGSGGSAMEFELALAGRPGEVPVPAAVWLFGTALIGFIGFSRRTKV
jgi:hypothetical protein